MAKQLLTNEEKLQNKLIKQTKKSAEKIFELVSELTQIYDCLDTEIQFCDLDEGYKNLLHKEFVKKGLSIAVQIQHNRILQEDINYRKNLENKAMKYIDAYMQEVGAGGVLSTTPEFILQYQKKIY